MKDKILIVPIFPKRSNVLIAKSLDIFKLDARVLHQNKEGSPVSIDEEGEVNQENIGASFKDMEKGIQTSDKSNSKKSVLLLFINRLHNVK